MLQRWFPNPINRPSQPIGEPVRSGQSRKIPIQTNQHPPFSLFTFVTTKQSRVRPSLYAEEGHASAAAACVY
jgi:hypothetical protein